MAGRAVAAVGVAAVAAAAAAVDQILQASAGMTRWMPRQWGEAEAKARCSPGRVRASPVPVPEQPDRRETEREEARAGGRGRRPTRGAPDAVWRCAELKTGLSSRRRPRGSIQIDTLTTTVAILLEHDHQCTLQVPGLSWR